MISLIRRKSNPGELKRVAPIVNVRDTDKEIILEAEMAGLSKENIKVEVDGDKLRIRGTRKSCETPKGYTVIYRERCPFEYLRTFILDDEVKRDNISAHYDNGVLTLTLEKSDTPQPERIEIKG